MGVLFSFNVKQLHPELGLQASAVAVVGNEAPAGAVATLATATIAPPTCGHGM